jgi:DNA-binding transcriptional LysR family regulator
LLAHLEAFMTAAGQRTCTGAADALGIPRLTDCSTSSGWTA